MKQIVFISGKGGTGKSTLVASLAFIAKHKMLADCDVDAPDLHLLLDRDQVVKEDFFGAKEAIIKKDICTDCGRCRDICRFEAISENIEILPFKCEGCGACMLVCPVDAIELVDIKTGETYNAQTPQGQLSDALLDIGAEGSGRLVTRVRKNAQEAVKDEKYLLIDGSPGIGCAVIASITGADAVVVVTEPTYSGLSDLKRILQTADHFDIPAFICINKYDLNLDVTAEIERYCEDTGKPVISKIPFEPKIVMALENMQTPVQAGLESITEQIIGLWEKMIEELDKI